MLDHLDAPVALCASPRVRDERRQDTLGEPALRHLDLPRAWAVIAGSLRPSDEPAVELQW